jgi:DUF4097 and DUF4098 domain-containing protein YvlB
MLNRPLARSVYAVMKFRTPAIAVGLALASGACTVTVDSHSEIVRQEKRFTVDGRADVRVTTFDGAIEIQSWDKPDVMIEIEKRGPTKAALEELEISAEQKGRVIELEVKRPREESFSGIGLHRTATARLIVNVPRDTDIRARSGDGSIRIERINGRIDLRTGDGSIRASDVSGELILDTGDGSVTVDEAQGKLTLDTADGSVNVSGKLSVLSLHTGDGSIVYRVQPGAKMVEPWEITTGDGSVSLYLPAEFDADLDAHTGDGTIRNDLGIENPDKESGRRTLRAKIGDGGKLLRIRTGDGTIRLKAN